VNATSSVTKRAEIIPFGGRKSVTPSKNPAEGRGGAKLKKMVA